MTLRNGPRRIGLEERERERESPPAEKQTGVLKAVVQSDPGINSSLRVLLSERTQ